MSAIEALLFLGVFLAVASAFGGVVLTTGINSSQRLDRTLNDALARSDAGPELRGPVIAVTDGERVTALSVDIGLSSSNGEVPLAPQPTGERVVVSYVDEANNISALPYRVEWTVGDGDTLLEAGELAELVIDLRALAQPLVAGSSFRVDVRPPRGTYVVISRTVPQGSPLDTYVSLN